MKKNKEEKAPNICLMTERFNDVSYLSHYWLFITLCTDVSGVCTLYMKGGLFGLFLWKFQEMLNCKNSKTKFPSSFRYKHCLWLDSTFLFCIMISALFKRCCVVPKKINCIKSIKLCKPKPRSSENSSLISFKKFSILAEFFL